MIHFRQGPALRNKQTDMKRIIAIILTAIMATGIMQAQVKVGSSLELDKTVHNFGDILMEKGPVSCTFTVSNTGQKPAVIYNVVSTCGCTDVSWTREPIMPGKSGRISATYSNDEGAYPFDKTLTVYFSDVKKPVTLKLRGVSLAKKQPLTELYPVQYGPLALKSAEIKCGNLEQGGVKSESVNVANISGKPIKVEFRNVSKQLKVSVSPNPIPANSTAEMSFTVTADRSLWGKNFYYAEPVVNGKSFNKNISFWAFTKENFSGLTDNERKDGPRPHFDESTYSFGKVKKGTKVQAEFTFRNDGKKPFNVYKVNADAKAWSHSDIPAAAPGEKVTFTVTLDTTDLPKGEHLTIVTLTTDSPLRPIVNLFIAGWIE